MRRPGTPQRRPVTPQGPEWLTPLPVETWMRRPVITILPQATAAGALGLMRRGKFRHLPVVDARGKLVGVVSDRDLGRSASSVGEVMTRDVVTVQPSTDIRQAARLMRERKIGCLPVVEDGRLVGILTEADVLCALEELLRSHVTRPTPARPGDTVGRPYDFGFQVPGGEPASPNQGAGD